MYDSIIILGATATGKTNLAISLAKKLNTEIINADSMYVYKYFDIGTAKPSKEELSQVKHYLVDFLEPHIDYSVASFREDVKDIIEKNFNNNKIPIIVGGTGFYIESLIKPFTYGSAEKNLALRQKLLAEQEKYGNEYLYEKLKELDYDTSLKLHKNDTKRVIRAIEIFMTSGSKKSEIVNDTQIIFKSPLIIGLNIDRNVLYNRINSRVDNMINNGLIEEVKKLYNLGYSPDNCNAMKGIGYKEIVSYLNNECTLEEAIEKIKQHTRNYAKRQITWFKRNENIIWCNPSENNLADKIINILYSKEN